jgi:hypothetical protein
MKAYFILINWTLSFTGLTMATDNNPLWAVALGVAWFAVSSILLIRADRRGDLKNIEKRFKIDEL